MVTVKQIYKKNKFTDIFRKLTRIVFRVINLKKIIREKNFENKKKNSRSPWKKF